MLVLSRRPGEEIIIDDHIRVTVVSVKGDRVRIGITAPEEVQVDRAEVHERRMAFHEVEIPVAAVVGHDDEAVALGEMPKVVVGADDTHHH
jgi:carbon storage regulator